MTTLSGRRSGKERRQNKIPQIMLQNNRRSHMERRVGRIDENDSDHIWDDPDTELQATIEDWRKTRE